MDELSENKRQPSKHRIRWFPRCLWDGQKGYNIGNQPNQVRQELLGEHEKRELYKRHENEAIAQPEVRIDDAIEREQLYQRIRASTHPLHRDSILLTNYSPLQTSPSA